MSANIENGNELAEQYREKFLGLKDSLHTQLHTYLAESIIDRSFESPELKAQIAVYKPIVESVVRVLKESGILNSNKTVEPSPIDESIVSVITEQTEVINNQTNKIKELKMRVKLHEMISSNLSGLNKDIIKEAITKFQGEDELSDEDLIKELTAFVNTRKSSPKKVQFESINADIDEVSSILDGNAKGGFRPSKNISIPGLRKRVVNEANELRIPSESDDVDLDPANEFMRDFSHLG